MAWSLRVATDWNIIPFSLAIDPTEAVLVMVMCPVLSYWRVCTVEMTRARDRKTIGRKNLKDLHPFFLPFLYMNLIIFLQYFCAMPIFWAIYILQARYPKWNPFLLQRVGDCCSLYLSKVHHSLLLLLYYFLLVYVRTLHVFQMLSLPLSLALFPLTWLIISTHSSLAFTKISNCLPFSSSTRSMHSELERREEVICLWLSHKDKNRKKWRA